MAFIAITLRFMIVIVQISEILFSMLFCFEEVKEVSVYF